MHDPNHKEGDLYQYTCTDCYYQREGLLDDPFYSTICPRCGGSYCADKVLGIVSWKLGVNAVKPDHSCKIEEPEE